MVKKKKKERKSACNIRDLDLIPGSRRSPGGENSNPLQYSCLENPQRQSSLTGCSPRGHKDLDTTEQLSMHTHTHTHTHTCVVRHNRCSSIPGSGRSPGEGNGNPLQYSCLENSMDRGTWRVKIHRVEKSGEQLKRLSMQARGKMPYSFVHSFTDLFI